MQLDFNAEEHSYRLDGRPVPSVTRILKPLDMFEHVPLDVLERAREFGQHVHLACDLDDKGLLDEATLDAELLPYLRGWRRFLAESGFQIIASEQPVAHAKLGYAGTLDRRAIHRNRRVILDIKSGQMPLSVGPQVSAYAEAWGHQSGERGLKRYCVQVMPDAYKLHELTDPADWSIFLSCLNLHKFLNRSAT